MLDSKIMSLLRQEISLTEKPDELAAAIANQRSLLQKSMQSAVEARKNYASMRDEDALAYSAWANSLSRYGMGDANVFFPGYGFLTMIQQDPLINAGVTSIANEMTRKWGKVESLSDDDRRDRVESIEGALSRLKVRSIWRDALLKTSLFGGCLVYLDVRDKADPMREPDDGEVATPLFVEGTTNYERSKLRGKFVAGLKVIEPITAFAVDYDALNPTSAKFYNPQSWLISGKKIHASRLLYFSDNPVAQILKPAYMFFGISQAQLAYDYVRAFNANRKAAQRLLQKFSLLLLMTDLDKVTQSGEEPGGTNVRLRHIATHRDNDAIVVADKESEEFVQVNTPLSGVKEIWYSSLELVPMAFRIPTIKMLEQTPGGLNATGETDLRNFYDEIGVRQENVAGPPMEHLLRVMRGCMEDDDDSTHFKFAPLYQMNDVEAANVALTKAQTEAVYTGIGALNGEEIRLRLSKDPDGDFNGVELMGTPGDFETDGGGAPEWPARLFADPGQTPALASRLFVEAGGWASRLFGRGSKPRPVAVSQGGADVQGSPESVSPSWFKRRIINQAIAKAES